MPTEHEHSYTMGPIVFVIGDKFVGGSENEVLYYQQYFCTRCLARVYEKLDFSSGTFSQIRFMAVPIPENDKELL